MEKAIDVQNLVVEYGKGQKAFRAVDDISFSVSEGECVGFIGVNGAGKSTTIKTLLGFIFPKSGQINVLGEKAASTASRQQIGYLPEVALYYPFMKPLELLKLYGGLHGLRGADLKKKSYEVLSRVGLEGKESILLKNFSKGMQQRVGIAQALIADPKLLILDELSSGLDPVGRHDLRDLILELKERGRTIFFSSHELTEVEALCDRVIIIHRGKVIKQAATHELMKPLNQFEVVFEAGDNIDLPDSVTRLKIEKEGAQSSVLIDDVQLYSQVLADLAKSNIPIIKSSSKSISLEDYYIELVKQQGKER